MSGWSGALSGAGEGLMIAGKQFGEWLRESSLQQQAAEITAMRDKTLASYQGQRDLATRSGRIEDAPVLADIETNALVRRQGALQPGELDTARARAQIEGDARVETARRSPRTLAPGASEVVDGQITTTAPEKELSPAQQDALRAKTRKDTAEADAIERGLRSGGGRDMPADMQKVRDMVESGFATDLADAYKKIGSSRAKPDDAVVMGLVNTMLQSGRYRGPDANERAVADAVGTVRRIRDALTNDEEAGINAGFNKSHPMGPRGPSASPALPQGGRSYSAGGATFTDADIAFTAKKHGMTPERVKQILGVQ